MGRSISPMREAKVAGSGPTAAPRLIVPMSLRLAIPWRVALQQSSPPLHQPGVILKQKEQLGKENPLNGKCASSKLSQPRGSPQKPVLLKTPTHRHLIHRWRRNQWQPFRLTACAVNFDVIEKQRGRNHVE